MAESENTREGGPDLGSWSLSEEREFMENLLNQRFNFFLVLFSLFLAAAFTSETAAGRTLVLAFGVLVLFLVWLTIYRAHVKHHWIMQHLYSRHEHPAAIVNTGVRNQVSFALWSVSRWIGILIPWVCLGILLTLAILSHRGWFEHGDEEEARMRPKGLVSNEEVPRGKIQADIGSSSSELRVQEEIKAVRGKMERNGGG